MISRLVFGALAASRGMQTFASKYGLRRRYGFGRQFVAGDTVDDAIAVAQRVESAGFSQTLQYLGTPVGSMADADAATRACVAIINRIAASGIGRNLSVRLTDLGLTVDRATCVDNLRRVLDPATAQEFFVRVEMEDSRYTQLTLDIFQTLWQQGYRNAGLDLQAYLSRSLDDTRRMNALGARVRLVKGAYAEPRRVAYRSKAKIDRAFIAIMELLLSEGTGPAFGTHDRALIDATRTFAASRAIAPDAYEFHMLYGVREELQAMVRQAGSLVRVAIPFGPGWFPYVMQRLGNHPTDVRFLFRTLISAR